MTLAPQTPAQVPCDLVAPDAPIRKKRLATIRKDANRAPNLILLLQDPPQTVARVRRVIRFLHDGTIFLGQTDVVTS